MEGNSNATETSPHYHAEPTRRDIDEILQRRRRRLRQRRHHYPPDMLHGDTAIGEIYDVLGSRWPEHTGFVDAAVGRDGEAIGWSIGTFDDHFLTVDHELASQTEHPAETISAQLEDRSRVLVRVADDGVSARRAQRLSDHTDLDVIRLPCASTLLETLESKHLGVTRDFSIRRNHGSVDRKTRLQASRLNLLSVVGLCTVWTQ